MKTTLVIGALIGCLPLCFGQTDFPTFDWEGDLSFDASDPQGQPLPNNWMHLVAHRGELYLALATSKEPDNYSDRSSYIFKKSSSAAPWELEQQFESKTDRVSAMASVRFENDALGQAIPGGPVEILLASTNKGRTRAGTPLQVRVLDDDTGAWQDVDVSSSLFESYNTRDLFIYRDKETNADLVFVAAGDKASNSEVGIFSGAYDAASPGGILWNGQAEFVGPAKWFGFAEANGQLFVTARDRIYKRIDGTSPSWIQVVEVPRDAGTTQREVRGLTAVSSIGYPEEEMLLFATQGKTFKLRAGGDYAFEIELDVTSTLRDILGLSIHEAEAAMNADLGLYRSRSGEEYRFVGVQFAFGENTSNFVCPLNPLEDNDMADQVAYAANAFYWLRREDGTYSNLFEVANSNEDLVLARDWINSPFPDEPHTVYSTGYNASVVKATCDEPQLGKAWVYKGTEQEEEATIAMETIQYHDIEGVDPNLLSLDIYFDPGHTTNSGHTTSAGHATNSGHTTNPGHTTSPGHATSPKPVIFYVHGGAWKQGDKANTQVKDELFIDNDYVFVSTNYRLSPDCPPCDLEEDSEAIRFPTHPQDVSKAIRWVYDNIAFYGGDPHNIYLMGHSAGAHIANIISTNESFLAAQGLTLEDIACTCSLDNGVFDVEEKIESSTPNSRQLYLNAFGFDESDWMAASPLLNVKGKHLIFCLSTRIAEVPAMKSLPLPYQPTAIKRPCSMPTPSTMLRSID